MRSLRSARKIVAMPNALDEPTLCAAFQHTAVLFAERPALRSAGGPLALTWRDYSERVRAVAGGLASLGVGRGDAVALLLTNRPEANVVDAAAMHLGAVPFSIYATAAPEQMAYVLRDAGARVVVTERALVGHLDAAALEHGVPLEQVVLVDDRGGTLSLDELEERQPTCGHDFDAAWRAVGSGDLATLIYTSGTTGPPKGVELTHANVLAAWRGMEAAWGVGERSRAIVSYLPSAHVADRFSAHYAAMIWGSEMTCCPDPRQIVALLPEVRPTMFVAVPRIWEKAKAGIERAVAADPEPARREAVQAALRAGVERVRLEQRGDPVPTELERACARAEERVFAGMRERLGLDRCVVAIAAGAPTSVDVLELFHAIGIRIAELYGLSETCAVTTANPLERIKLGTVGRAIPGVELRLQEDGELLVRGPTVMRGYRDRPTETAAAIDADGWMHTGDVAEIDGDGYVRIIDRKKELIINAAGKNMSPANIEATVKAASPLIGQVCCVGDRRPYNVALISLDPDAANGSTVGELAADPRVVAEVAEAVQRANARLSRVEQIKRYLVLDHPWLPGGAELTPTMKLCRRAVGERYGAAIEGLYA
jgi:long-chain acyl-CoA synthetase